MSAPVDVLAVLRTTYCSPESYAALAELIEAAAGLSADLEHAIAVANFGNPETVDTDHPIRRALDQLDAALALVRGAA